MKRFYRHITFLAIGCLMGCSFAPKYERPTLYIPNHYKESIPWVVAHPTFANANNPRWWEMFEDPILNQLEEQLVFANQDLKVALAQFENAVAELQISRSALFPTINGDAHAVREQLSTNTANPFSKAHFSDFLLGADLSYEIDIWGKVRNTVKASKDLAIASRDDVAAVQLSLQANLAAIYFSLRGDEANIRILKKLVIAYQKALDINRYRFEGGIVPEISVYQAQTQLEDVKTLLTDTQLQRAQKEHAIAILTGKAPAAFCIAESTQQGKIVPISPELPSTLLERRPDVAAAERRVQAANATIGVARAAFFPSFNLMGTIIGFESSTIGKLLNSDSFYWTIGPMATGVIFDGGKLLGQLNQAKANYHQTVANYRQTVLSALQDVEDNLVAQRDLEKENITQAASTFAAHKALEQAQYMYDGGLTTYLDVVIEENTALRGDLALIGIYTRRQVTSVQLVKALGGGWESTTCIR